MHGGTTTPTRTSARLEACFRRTQHAFPCIHTNRKTNIQNQHKQWCDNYYCIWSKSHLPHKRLDVSVGKRSSGLSLWLRDIMRRYEWQCVFFCPHTLSAPLSLPQSQFQMTEHSADSSLFRNYCWWHAAFWRLCFGVFEASLVPWELAEQHTCSRGWISSNVSLGSADPAAWELTDTAQWELWSADHLQKGGLVMDTENAPKEEKQKATRKMVRNTF